MYLNTLGVAQYRCAQFEQAVETLKKSAEANRKQHGSDAPHDWVFIAMAQQQMGQRDQAIKSLAQARDIIARRAFPFGSAAELNALLREASQLIGQAQK
jgi:tetratricopeptide (TPR) repeat protein